MKKANDSEAEDHPPNSIPVIALTLFIPITLKSPKKNPKLEVAKCDIKFDPNNHTASSTLIINK